MWTGTSRVTTANSTYLHTIYLVTLEHFAHVSWIVIHRDELGGCHHVLQIRQCPRQAEILHIGQPKRRRQRPLKHQVFRVIPLDRIIVGREHSQIWPPRDRPSSYGSLVRDRHFEHARGVEWADFILIVRPRDAYAVRVEPRRVRISTSTIGLVRPAYVMTACSKAIDLHDAGSLQKAILNRDQKADVWRGLDCVRRVVGM